MDSISVKNICFVYVIQSGKGKHMPVKIGMSENPEKRIKQLQTGNPNLLRIIALIKCRDRKHASLVEKTFHSLMIDKNLLNEWFSPKKGVILKSILKMSDSDSDATISADSKKLANRTNTPKERAAYREVERKTKAIKSITLAASKRNRKIKIMKKMLMEFGVDHKEIDAI